jgi:hypothetical protein
MKGSSSSYANLGQLKTTTNIYVTILLCLIKQAFNIHEYFDTGWLLSAFSITWEGFCLSKHFPGRAFLRLVIFVREGFCPTIYCTILSYFSQIVLYIHIPALLDIHGEVIGWKKLVRQWRHVFIKKTYRCTFSDVVLAHAIDF